MKKFLLKPRLGKTSESHRYPEQYNGLSMFLLSQSVGGLPRRHISLQQALLCKFCYWTKILLLLPVGIYIIVSKPIIQGFGVQGKVYQGLGNQGLLGFIRVQGRVYQGLGKGLLGFIRVQGRVYQGLGKGLLGFIRVQNWV